MPGILPGVGASAQTWVLSGLVGLHASPQLVCKPAEDVSLALLGGKRQASHPGITPASPQG